MGTNFFIRGSHHKWHYGWASPGLTKRIVRLKLVDAWLLDIVDEELRWYQIGSNMARGRPATDSSVSSEEMIYGGR